MPDFETIEVPGTAAQQAVSYIMQRVVNDRNFSWYMFGTQALRLCIQAEAERLQISEKEVEDQLHERYKAASPRLERNGAGKADVIQLREALEKASERIEELMDTGGIDFKVAEELKGLLRTR